VHDKHRHTRILDMMASRRLGAMSRAMCALAVLCVLLAAASEAATLRARAGFGIQVASSETTSESVRSFADVAEAALAPPPPAGKSKPAAGKPAPAKVAAKVANPAPTSALKLKTLSRVVVATNGAHKSAAAKQAVKPAVNTAATNALKLKTLSKLVVATSAAQKAAANKPLPALPLSAAANALPRKLPAVPPHESHVKRAGEAIHAEAHHIKEVIVKDAHIVGHAIKAGALKVAHEQHEADKKLVKTVVGLAQNTGHLAMDVGRMEVHAAKNVAKVAVGAAHTIHVVGHDIKAGNGQAKEDFKSGAKETGVLAKAGVKQLGHDGKVVFKDSEAVLQSAASVIKDTNGVATAAVFTATNAAGIGRYANPAITAGLEATENVFSSQSRAHAHGHTPTRSGAHG
jgi:hypothetical protein